MRGLSKITILDFSKLLPGPYATMLLADMGCRVIKVELPHWPDMLRGVAPEIDGHGFIYWMANRNKESLCLDFRKPEGRKALLRLIARSDVLMEGFRPGMMSRMGLGHKELTRRFPRLIYCSLTGFGQDGPLSARAGHDINFLAESGFMGAGDSNKAYSFPATQVADLAGSHTAATAVLGALLDRVRSGRGRHIDISMTEVMLSWLVLPLGHAFSKGKPYDSGEFHWWDGQEALYRVYRTQDGRSLSVAAVERPFAEALLRTIQRPDLLKLLGATGQGSRKRLNRELEAVFRKKTLRQWESVFQGKDVCVSPVRTVAEAVRAAAKGKAGLLGTVRSGSRKLLAVRSPIRNSREDYKPRRLPPALGRDNDAVLRSFLFSSGEITALKKTRLLQRPRRLRGKQQP